MDLELSIKSVVNISYVARARDVYIAGLDKMFCIASRAVHINYCKCSHTNQSKHTYICGDSLSSLSKKHVYVMVVVHTLYW